MTSTNAPPETGIIKIDRQGRARYSEGFKQQALEAFEQSGLSGMEFAQQCGVKYPTFASWVQKRRKQGAESSGEKSSPQGAPKFLLAEIREETAGGGVRVSLPGGLEARAGSREEVLLLAELIKALG